MILVKGEKVWFTLPSGKKVVCPASFGMLHDVDGEHFGKCTLLVGPISRTTHAAPLRGKARDYFGRKYDAQIVRVPRIPAMGSFKEIGPVVQIDYTRRGAHKGWYFHPFKRGVHPVLSKSGRWWKLEMGSCTWDDRGIVFP